MGARKVCIVQVLEDLPSHLVDLVFASQATPLSQKFASLPQAWHAQIVAAHFPSITRSRSLSLHGVHEGRWLPSHAYASLFKGMQSLTSLRELFIDLILLRGAFRELDVFTLLTETVSGLHSLRALRLRRVSEQVPYLNSSELWQGVRRLTALTAFEVTDSELHPECARHIATVIHCLTNLERLVIRPPSRAEGRFERRGCMSPGQLQTCFGAELTMAVQQLPRLTHLDLHWYDAALWKANTDAASHALDLSHLQHLRHLDLSVLDAEFNASGVCLNLAGCSNLQHLDLSQREVDDTSLTESLAALSALTHLSLFFPSWAHVATVSSVLGCCALHCSKLSTLQLELNCEAEQSSITSLSALTCLLIDARTFAPWCSNVTALVSLERLEVIDDWYEEYESLGVAVHSMSQMPQLKSLRLSDVPPEFNHQSLAAFAQLTQLTYLQLATEREDWDDGPFTALASSLSSLRSLQALHIAGGGDFLFWIRAVDILPAVSALPHLRHLHIPATGLLSEEDEEDEDGRGGRTSAAAALAAAVKALLSSLESLDVGPGMEGWGIQVSSSVPGLVDALCSHTALTCLSFEVESADALLQVRGVLQALPRLQEVFVNFSTPGQSLPSEVEDVLSEVMRQHMHLDVFVVEEEGGEKRLDCLRGS